MHEPHALRHQRSDVQHVAERTALAHDPELLQTLHQLEAVVRRPAEDKQGHQGDDETQGLALLPAAGVAKGPEDADVAVEHDEQREAEAHNQADQLQSHTPLGGVILDPHLAQEHHMVVRNLGGRHLLEGEDHAAQGQAAHPDDGAGDLGVTGAALPAGADGVDDGQVAVEADAGQEEDAAVVVEGEEGARDLAQGQPEHPLIGPLYGKQGQGEGQQEVGNGQVEEEGVGQGEGAGSATLRVSVAADDAQHQHVANHSQDEQQGVNSRGVAARKAVNVLLRAWSSDGPHALRWHGVVFIIRKNLLNRGRKLRRYFEILNRGLLMVWQ